MIYKKDCAIPSEYLEELTKQVLEEFPDHPHPHLHFCFLLSFHVKVNVDPICLTIQDRRGNLFRVLFLSLPNFELSC